MSMSQSAPARSWMLGRKLRRDRAMRPSSPSAPIQYSSSLRCVTVSSVDAPVSPGSVRVSPSATMGIRRVDRGVIVSGMSGNPRQTIGQGRGLENALAQVRHVAHVLEKHFRAMAGLVVLDLEGQRCPGLSDLSDPADRDLLQGLIEDIEVLDPDREQAGFVDQGLEAAVAHLACALARLGPPLKYAQLTPGLLDPLAGPELPVLDRETEVVADIAVAQIGAHERVGALGGGQAAYPLGGRQIEPA